MKVKNENEVAQSTSNVFKHRTHRASVFYPCDFTDWALRLTATAQNHEGVSYHVLLAWEKIKIQSPVSTERLSLFHQLSGKVKKS